MKKLICTGLVFALLLTTMAACGKTPDASGSQGGTQATAAPTPTPPPYEANVLTGLPYEGSYPQTKRFAAVMVNNISNNAKHNIRPQAGLSQADILTEIRVEGGITRFMAMYSNVDNLPEKVGPVRSARDQFFQVFLPFQPLFVHIGESVKQTEYKTNYDYATLDVDLDRATNARYTDSALRAKGVAEWEIAFSDKERILSAIESGNKDTNRTYNSTFFNFVHYSEPERELTGDVDGNNYEAHKIDIVHSEGYRTYFTYDEGAKQYKMSQYSLAMGGVHDTIDANSNEQLAFKNVLVLFTEMGAYPGHEEKDLQLVDWNSGGVGYYFSNGGAEFVRWSKGAPNQVLRITDKGGNDIDIQVNPGKTYLGVVDLDEAPRFVYYPSEATAAGAGEVQVDKEAAQADIVTD